MTDTQIEAGIARALASATPGLYATLGELVRAGQTKNQIMARVHRMTRGTLTANAIETTVDYLMRFR